MTTMTRLLDNHTKIISTLYHSAGRAERCKALVCLQIYCVRCHEEMYGETKGALSELTCAHCGLAYYDDKALEQAMIAFELG